MMGIELAVGYVCAYLVRKARRAGGRVDEDVDQALDAGLDRLHALVQERLGESPGLQEAEQLSALAGATADDVTGKAEKLKEEMTALSRRDSTFAAELQKAVNGVSITDSKGIQIGDRNHQVNNFN